MSRHHRFLFTAVLILLLAAALRFHLIESQSFWNDEGNSARLSERSISLIIEGTASDIHPPLYYLLLRGWRELLGDSEFSLRAMSAFIGLALAAATFSLGRRLLGSKNYPPALIAAFMVALNPALVYYSQETRMYELLAFLALISTLLLVKWLQSGYGRLVPAAGYVILAAAGLYTHYFFPAVLVAQNLVFFSWLIYHGRGTGGRTSASPSRKQLYQTLGSWLIMMLLVWALYLPWFQVFWEQAGDRAAERGPILSFLQEGMLWLSGGPTISSGTGRWLAIAFIILAGLGSWLGRRAVFKGVRFLPTMLLGILTPFVLMWVLGATRPAYFKFMLVIIPPLCLLAGPGWWWAWNWPGSEPTHVGAAGRQVGNQARVSSASAGTLDEKRSIASVSSHLILGILGLVIIGGSGLSLANMYFDPAFARADYRGIARVIAEEAHPNAGIVLNAANQWEVFTYYYQGGSPVYPIPRGFPDQEEIDRELREISEKHDRLYAVFWGEAERDPQRLVERWLDAHAFKARDEWWGDVRFVTYAIPGEVDVPAGAEIDRSPDLSFGDHISLERFKIHETQLAPGEIAQITLYWTTDSSLEQRFKIFLHLLDQDGNLVAQRDSEPGGGLSLTSTWVPGQLVEDNHGLLIPAGIEPGAYNLILGLYVLDNPSERLTFIDQESEADAYPLATIIVGDG